MKFKFNFIAYLNIWLVQLSKFNDRLRLILKISIKDKTKWTYQGAWLSGIKIVSKVTIKRKWLLGWQIEKVQKKTWCFWTLIAAKVGFTHAISSYRRLLNSSADILGWIGRKWRLLAIMATAQSNDIYSKYCWNDL